MKIKMIKPVILIASSLLLVATLNANAALMEPTISRDQVQDKQSKQSTQKDPGKQGGPDIQKQAKPINGSKLKTGNFETKPRQLNKAPIKTKPVIRNGNAPLPALLEPTISR